MEAAFGGESKARNKYEFFAKRAEKEGKPQVAKLFRAAAEAERVHAKNHVNALGMIKSTEENLKTAIKGENYEYTEMYPEFIEKAKKENQSQGLQSFDWAKQVEEVHEALYKKALQAVKENKDLEKKEMFVCQGCGYTTEGEAPETCPVCSAPKEMFKKIE